jgi:CubicO group peptidase (beta-lactamase class C family)
MGSIGTARAQRARRVAERHVTEGRFASVEWLVMRDGREWQRGALGMADPHNGVALPEKPIYRIYSMTKPVVSALAMMLVEEGILHLYDPVAKWLPEFARMQIIGEDGALSPAKNLMLIENLMTHTAGLSYGFLQKCPAGAEYRKTNLRKTAGPLKDMIEIVATLPLAFEPGTNWRYSVATDVLARIVEVALGETIQHAVESRILSPLGLDDTGYSVAPAARDRIMPMFGNADLDTLMVYPAGPQKLTPADVSQIYPFDAPDFGRGGYGLFSTIDDYRIIADFLATGRTPSGEPLLGRKTLELMWTNRLPERMLPLRYDDILMPAYGFSLAGRVMIEPGKAWGLTSTGEHGWAGAAATWFMIDPKESLIAVVMTQYLGSKHSLADDMRNAIYSMLD